MVVKTKKKIGPGEIIPGGMKSHLSWRQGELSGFCFKIIFGLLLTSIFFHGCHGGSHEDEELKAAVFKGRVGQATINHHSVHPGD
ncbi:MAG: hypothetical protein EXR99_04395 [Gemmataceae bacterium]|nr:hypothetical protein [Gemmataceae bacterium]